MNDIMMQGMMQGFTDTIIKEAYGKFTAIGAGVGALGGAFVPTKGEKGRRWKNIAGGAAIGAGAGAGIRAIKGKNIKKYTGAGKVNSAAKDTEAEAARIMFARYVQKDINKRHPGMSTMKIETIKDVDDFLRYWARR